MKHLARWIALVALPFAGSCVAALLGTNARNAEAYLAGAVALVGLLVVVATYPRVVGGGVVHCQAAWMPELGLEFKLRMDGFAWALAALITGVGLLVVLYARYYMSSDDPVPRFYGLDERPVRCPRGGKHGPGRDQDRERAEPGQVLRGQRADRTERYRGHASEQQPLGTVLAGIGMSHAGATGGALFYLASSTLGIAALFLLIEQRALSARRAGCGRQ